MQGLARDEEATEATRPWAEAPCASVVRRHSSVGRGRRGRHEGAVPSGSQEDLRPEKERIHPLVHSSADRNTGWTQAEARTLELSPVHPHGGRGPKP